MKVYIICPVRRSTRKTTKLVSAYVEYLEQLGRDVFWPQRDVKQSLSGTEIVKAELDAIRGADEIHILWDDKSLGSHFDLGATMAMNKPIRFVRTFRKSNARKTYEKVIYDYETTGGF